MNKRTLLVYGAFLLVASLLAAIASRNPNASWIMTFVVSFIGAYCFMMGCLSLAVCWLARPWRAKVAGLGLAVVRFAIFWGCLTGALWSQAGSAIPCLLLGLLLLIVAQILSKGSMSIPATEDRAGA